MNKQRALFLKILPILFLFTSTFAFSQTVIVSGEVVDSVGNLLPGVSIQVQGTGSGTQTNFNRNGQRLSLYENINNHR